MNKRHFLKLTITSLVGATLMAAPMVATAATIVTVQPQIELHKDNQLVASNPFRFDLFVLNIPNQPDSAELIYSYLPESPDENTIPALQPGHYFIRLYDRDGQLQNAGDPLKGIDFKLKLADTDDTLSQDDENQPMQQTGELKTLGDGTVVYDIPFEITQADYDQAIATETGIIDFQIDMVDTTTYDAIQAEPQPEDNQESQNSEESSGEESVDDQTEITSEPEEIVTTLQFVDEATGQPIEGIVVNFNGETYQTDADGAITFNQLNTDVYSLTIADAPAPYTGYLHSEVPLDLSESANTRVTYQLQAEEPETTHEHTVSVSDSETQVGIGDVRVRIGDQEFITDYAGQIYLNDVPEGTYSYEVLEVPEGYRLENQATTGELTVPNEYGTTWISLTAEQPTSSSIVLRAYDEASNPIAGVTATIGNHQLTTDETGQAHVEDIPAESTTYTIEPKTGYTLVSPEQVGTLDIDPEGAELAVTLRQEVSTGHVVITVVDESGAPVGGVNVNLNDQQVTTDSEGKAKFNAVETGHYTYTLDEQLPEGYLAGENMAGEVNVVADETVESTIQVASKPAVKTANIQVIDQDGQPVPGATVQVGQSQLETNQEGYVQFEYTEGESLNYQLLAVPAGYDLSESQDAKELTDPAETTQIVVQRLPEIRQGVLQIKDSSGHPIAGVEVEVNQQVLTTNQDGKVQFDYQPDQPVNYTVKSVPDHIELPEEAQSGQIDNPAEGKTIQLSPKPISHQVTFKVIDNNQQPVAGVGIQLNNQEAETDENGQVKFTDVPTGDYTYTISKVPDGYLIGEATGQIAVKDDREINHTVEIEKDNRPAQATLKVVDQDNQPVVHAKVAFGGLTGETNQEGLVKFEGLDSGFYTVNIEGLPSGYTNTYNSQKVEVKPGDDYNETLTVEKQPQVGRFAIQALNSENQQGVAGVVITIGDKSYKTDAAGHVETDDLSFGNYDFKIDQVPEGYELVDGSEGQKALDDTGNTDWTIQLKPVAEAESSSQNVNVASNNQRESQETTQVFKDEATGVEVWLTKEDAEKVSQLKVETGQQLSIPALENKDYTAYKIQAIDNQGLPVSLAHIAEVKLPVKPVQTKLNVIKPSGNTYQVLNYQLNQQKVSVRTQNLGDFAVVYGDLASADNNQANERSQSVTVSRSESVEEKNNLPKTGERSMTVITVVGVGLLALASYLIFTGKKRQSDK